jgi:hypothetical protein
MKCSCDICADRCPCKGHPSKDGLCPNCDMGIHKNEPRSFTVQAVSIRKQNNPICFDCGSIMKWSQTCKAYYCECAKHAKRVRVRR